MPASTAKINLKDKVEDGEIDLSMSDLQDVPVKEIAAIKSAHSLDLSNNHVTTLPRNFVILVNLTKLDLSKNQLKELPENFGELYKLKHLDLYKNQLQHLPLSFSKLKALRWLDLKDNPLMPAILSVAGPCLETKQCQNCARSIVSFYTKLNNKVEYEKSVREEQQKLFQENLEKSKPEKKKKAKKEKVVVKEPVEIPKSTVARIASVTKKSLTKPKQKSRLLPFYRNLLTVAFFILSLFLLTATKLECFQVVEDVIVSAWHLGVGKLPNNLQGIGIEFGNIIRVIHKWTADGIVITTQYISDFTKKETVNIIVTEMSQVFSNASIAATKIYHKLFGE
ncbi:hypothetical protein FQA39_LY06337 [Lamprigera yunnana]|nr:hypothetical protein FQA39_LY06337 [Lamprigera yunnana]